MFVPTPIRSGQSVSLISSTYLNLIEHVYVYVESIYVLPILYDKLVETIFVLFIQIAIPLDTFKPHLPKTFF